MSRGRPSHLLALLLSSDRLSARRFPVTVSDEDVAETLLCAWFSFLSSSLSPPHAQGHPEPRTQCSVPGTTSECAAVLLLSVGAGTEDRRGLSGFWCSLLHHPLSFFCAPPHPSGCHGAYWIAGIVLACLESHPHCVVCMCREGPLMVVHLVPATDICCMMSLWHCKMTGSGFC